MAKECHLSTQKIPDLVGDQSRAGDVFLCVCVWQGGGGVRLSVLLLTTSKLLLLIFFNCSENKLTLVYWRSLRWGCFRELNAANLEETVLSRMVDDLCEPQGRRRVFAPLFPALKKGSVKAGSNRTRQDRHSCLRPHCSYLRCQLLVVKL